MTSSMPNVYCIYFAARCVMLRNAMTNGFHFVRVGRHVGPGCSVRTVTVAAGRLHTAAVRVMRRTDDRCRLRSAEVPRTRLVEEDIERSTGTDLTDGPLFEHIILPHSGRCLDAVTRQTNAVQLQQPTSDPIYIYIYIYMCVCVLLLLLNAAPHLLRLCLHNSHVRPCMDASSATVTLTHSARLLIQSRRQRVQSGEQPVKWMHAGPVACSEHARERDKRYRDITVQYGPWSKSLDR